MLLLCQSCVALKRWRELLWTSTLRFSDNLFFNEKKWGVGGEGMGEAAEQLGISMNKKKKRDPFFHPSLLVRNVVGAPRAERVNSYFPFSCHRKKKNSSGAAGNCSPRLHQSPAKNPGRNPCWKGHCVYRELSLHTRVF